MEYIWNNRWIRLENYFVSLRTLKSLLQNPSDPLHYSHYTTGYRAMLKEEETQGHG